MPPSPSPRPESTAHAPDRYDDPFLDGRSPPHHREGVRDGDVPTPWTAAWAEALRCAVGESAPVEVVVVHVARHGRDATGEAVALQVEVGHPAQLRQLRGDRPVNALSRRNRCSRRRRLPSAAGIVPAKGVAGQEQLVRFLRLPSSAGMPPERSFS